MEESPERPGRGLQSPGSGGRGLVLSPGPANSDLFPPSQLGALQTNRKTPAPKARFSGVEGRSKVAHSASTPPPPPPPSPLAPP